MSLPLPAFVDERFLEHRLRATSIAGIATAVLALLLFMYRYYHDHVVRTDLLATGLLFVVVKYSLLFWYRRTD
ncbi:MAG TPA: hypothetical protein VGP25_16275 [Gemmatimonadaceae bacterium]|nr:hypothetical protein [Gemmatimonadaceae bacterium]